MTSRLASCSPAMSPGQLEAVFQNIRQTWGVLDFALHSIAFAPQEDLAAKYFR